MINVSRRQTNYIIDYYNLDQLKGFRVYLVKMHTFNINCHVDTERIYQTDKCIKKFAVQLCESTKTCFEQCLSQNSQSYHNMEHFHLKNRNFIG